MKAPSWRTVQAMEQARWLRFARAHPEHKTCARVLAAGRVSISEARALAALAAAHQWPIPRAGRANR